MLDHLRITLVAVGRCKQGSERDLFDHYMRRLSGKVTLKEVEDKSSGPAAQRREREGALILSALPKGAKVVALDERGRPITSRDFAKLLGQWRDAGEQEVAFVIGGADGLSEAVRTRADKLISFGAVTWPHLLVRGLLAEQLYRAQSILGGHPYHRD